MQLDLQAITLQPLRHTFDNLKERFGDKPATRYQEGTYDIQQNYLYHYRPTWDPDREIFDERRTAIKMADWYKFADPRQYYYGTYTIARSRQQEAADANFQLALDEGLADTAPDSLRKLLLTVLLPMRHVEWGANMNNTFISSYSYGTAINAATIFHAMDRLGIAQSISRVGLAVGGEEILDEAKTLWMDAPQWQPLRRYVEDTLVVKDWFELFIAQNLALDSFLYPFLYTHVSKEAGKSGSPFYTLATTFQKEWYGETSRWVDAMVKAAANESAENKALVQGWIQAYRAKAEAAVTALAETVFAGNTAGVMAAINADLDARLKKIGL
ncbi:MAG: phenol hydroxylase [Rhodocyclaceae bacterium]|nr:MAG: phenol hydroxylase [Rhodocyclaceae bacterium]